MNEQQPRVPAGQRRSHYLNAEYGIRSWLLTRDHKRIAILYLISISVFFLIGGVLLLSVNEREGIEAAHRTD